MRFRPLPPIYGFLLALLSMAAWAAEAETSRAPTLQFRRVLLKGQTEVVRLAPGIPTTISFDAEINPHAVRLGESPRVRLLETGKRSVTLLSEGDLGLGVELRVPFLSAPTLPEPVFKLVTGEATADAQVMVFRGANAPELMQARLTECEARCAACEAELAALRGKAVSPAEWVLAGQVGETGVRVTQRRERHGMKGLRAVTVRRYVAEAWVVLSVEVENNSGRPWQPRTAWLENPSTGRRVEARKVAMQPEVLPPAGRGVVAVELEWTPRWSGPPGEQFRWVLEAADGTRPLAIEGVVLEEGPVVWEKRGP